MDSLPKISKTSFTPLQYCPSVPGVENIKTRQNGFTLLELLAVVLIIGIIVSFASLSVGQKSSQVVQDEAERLNGLLRLANEEAVMQGRELALEFNESGYSFLELGSDNQWVPLAEDALFRDREFPSNLRIELIVEGAEASFEDEKNLPRVFILSSSELTPFLLTFSIDGEKSYTLRGTIDGKLTLSSNTEHEVDT